MEIARFHNKLFFIITAISGVIIFLESFFIRSALSFFRQAVAKECACEAGNFFVLHPIQSGIILILAGLFFAGIIYGCWYLFSTLLRTRRLISRIFGASLPLPSRLDNIANTLGLSGRLVFFANGRPEAFSFGLLRPKIAISTACWNNMTISSVEAVLCHEAHHLKKHDPLRFLILDIVRRVFFFLPLISQLVSFIRTLQEVEADGNARDSDALGKALLQFKVGGTQESIAHFAGALSVRFERLLNPKSPLKFNLGAKPLVFAVLFFAITGSLLLARPKQSTNIASCVIAAPCYPTQNIDKGALIYYHF